MIHEAPAIVATQSRGRTLLHAAPMLVLSFVMSANGNVLPQQFFQRYHAAHKVTYLAACLLLGTTCATAAVHLARRGGARLPQALIALALTLAAESSLFVVRGAASYALCNAAALAGANYLTNHVDLAAAARAGAHRRGLHDGVSNACRLFGFLAAPWFFTRFYGQTAVLGAVGLGAAALAVNGVAALFASSSSSRVAHTAHGDTPLDRADMLRFAYTVSLYVSMYLLAANVLYLFRDVARLDDPETRGGVTISLVFGSALVSNALSATARARWGRAKPSAGALLVPAGLLSFVAYAFAAGLARHYPTVLVGGAVLGVSYGFFLEEVRDWCSRSAREQGKTVLLTLFNNMTNMSSLLAFALLLGIASLRHGGNAYGLLLGLLGGLPLASTLLFAASARARRQA